ncbi:MAG TPA: fused MFS/spermidine synthase, partial [Gemmatimonadales bacterium]|nr:fused MFS/spermidine synthase [Gemmatimonadales bacterium]
MFGVLFFLSGATGLVYQLLWVRLLYQSFGSTIESVTTVVCAFLGGLGLGAWWLGRHADRHRRPAELYGWLEIGIAICGVGSPYVLDLAHRTYLALMISGQVPGAGVALRFGLASLVLLVPTTLMGGTLPALTRAVTAADRTRLESVLSRFYAANTLGAMLGAATAGFFLIEHAGIRASLWGAAAVNAGLAVAALILARSVDPIHQPVAAPAQIDLGRVPPWMPRAAFALLVTTAFASLLAEIAWTRVLVLLVAGSTYAFTLIVTVFLAGLGIGGALVSGPGRSRSRSVADAALAQGIVAAGSGLVFLSVTWLPEYLLRVFADPATGPVERLIWLLVPVGAVVLIPAIGMGMTFPLLTDLSAPPGEARGSDVGRAYAVNTIGSVIGAALTGFVLISAIGTQATLRVGTFLSTGAAIVLILGASRSLAPEAGRHPLRSRILGAAFLSGIGLSAALFAPRWDTARLDLGPAIYGRELRTAADRRGFLRHRGARQIAFREGRNAAVSVWDSNVGRGLSINGKADASDDVDMETQVMLGIAPLAARPTARSALVIGLGSGVTTRVAADAPTMERVRVVEIEPAVVAMSQFFAHVNDFVLR